MTAASTAARPLLIVYTSVIGKGARQQEDQLAALGFDVESKSYDDLGGRAPSVAKFAAVVCVIDQVRRGAWIGPQTAAKIAGIPFFAVTRRSSDPTWKPLKDWAVKLGLTLPEPVESTQVPEGKTSAQLQREVEGWQKLAQEYEEDKTHAEREKDAAVAKTKDAESELSRTKEIVESSRRAGLALRRELEVATADLKDARAQRDELAARLRETRAREVALETAVRDLRAEITELRVHPVENSSALEELRKKLNSTTTMLTRARDERDEARAQLKTLEDGVPVRAIDEMASKLWSLVEAEVLDAEEAFEKLARYAKGGK